MIDKIAAAVADLKPATAPNPKQKHHYVPVLYTKAWIDPTQSQKVLWRYRHGEHPRMKGPQGVGYQHLFYEASDLPPVENDIEDELMGIENIAAPYFEKLRSGGIANLTAQEKAELSTPGREFRVGGAGRYTVIRIAYAPSPRRLSVLELVDQRRDRSEAVRVESDEGT